MTPLLLSALLLAAPPAPLVSGLVNPESVAIGPGGKVYVSAIGEFDKAGDGAIFTVEDGKLVPFVAGLDDPKGIAFHLGFLYVADRNRVLKIDPKGTIAQFAPPNAFPSEPMFLNDVVIDPEGGNVYVSDSGDRKGGGGAVFRISPNGVVSLVTDHTRIPGLNIPNGLAMDGASFLLLADFGTGDLYRVKIADGTSEKVASGLGAGDGLAWDHYGRLFVSDYKGGKVHVIPRPGAKPVLVAEGFKAAADICIDHAKRRILVPDMTAGTLSELPAQVPGEAVDESPFPLKTELAFADMKWTGWEKETDTGKPSPLRPIVLTHAHDGSGRTFVATEQGVIHVIPNEANPKATKVFLDISSKVQYDDKTNEEGLLGMVFHPKYKENGEFFVYYTPKNPKKTNYVVRFKVSKDDPDKADPASETIVLKYENRPFWNHAGGTIVFGPDGMLYVFHGDGGAGNDPFGNGQNLNTWFGKILRIDVNNPADGKAYSVPKDNPFVGKENAKPEIWAYGLRNIWRMAFDKATGQLWAGEVGQNLYEEINLIKKGGNYGWNAREALHPFGGRGSGPKPEFIEPIWEYHHEVGRSITGGGVYNGKKHPELVGHYLYADYTSSKIWALKYDAKEGRVTANRPIPDKSRPVISFGEDEKGEMYLLTVAADGKGIFGLAK